MKYCANCDAVAVEQTPDNKTPLCLTCATAYEWGMAAVIAKLPQSITVFDLLLQDIEDEEEQCTSS